MVEPTGRWLTALWLHVRPIEKGVAELWTCHELGRPTTDAPAYLELKALQRDWRHLLLGLNWMTARHLVLAGPGCGAQQPENHLRGALHAEAEGCLGFHPTQKWLCRSDSDTSVQHQLQQWCHAHWQNQRMKMPLHTCQKGLRLWAWLSLGQGNGPCARIE